MLGSVEERQVPGEGGSGRNWSWGSGGLCGVGAFGDDTLGAFEPSVASGAGWRGVGSGAGLARGDGAGGGGIRGKMVAWSLRTSIALSSDGVGEGVGGGDGVHKWLALDRGAVEGVWEGNSGVASRGAAAGGGGGGDVCHDEANCWAEAGELVRWAGSTVSVQRTLDSGGRTAWLNQQLGL